MPARHLLFGSNALASVAFACAITLAVPEVAQAQGYATITPGDGYFDIDAQVQVHVELCSPDSWFDAWGAILVNGQFVGSTTPGSSSGCNDFQSGDITVTVAQGTTTVSVSAADGNGPVTAQVTYTAPPPVTPPGIDVTPHNGYHWNAGLCVLACFNAVVGYTTPAYYTRDVPRAVTLQYSSGQVQGRHTIQVNAWNTAPITPDWIWLSLRRSDNSYVTFTNGSTQLLFHGWASGMRRLTAQFDDTALTTGAYNYTVEVGALSSYGSASATAALRLLVLNERNSPYGAGWALAGVQHLKVGPGDSLTIADGAGSIEFWPRASCDGTGCTFSPPLGTFDRLRFTNTGSRTDSVAAYVRTTADRNTLTFDDLGRLRYADDRFGNRTTFKWLDPQRLSQIIDPTGQITTLTYDGSNRLASIRDSLGRRTTAVTINGANDLVQIQDAAGLKPFQSAVYDAAHRLLARADRRGNVWKYGYDVAGKLAADSTPAITVNGVSQHLVTAYQSPITTAVLAPGSLTPDSAAIATFTPAVGDARKWTLDAYGALVAVISPVGEFSRYTRNAHGQATETLDSTGHHYFNWSGPRVTYDYNSITGAQVTYEWDTTYNRVTHQSGGGGPDIRYWYGTNGRLDSTRVSTDTPATRYSYDAYGRVLTATDPRGHITRYYYGATGLQNMDSVKLGSRRVALFYDGIGRPVALKNPINVIDSAQYDTLNRIRRVVGPLSQVMTFSYGDSLNLTAVTDAMNHVYGLEKNAIGWDTAKVDPLGHRDLYTYDRTGRVLTWTNRRGQMTALAYDTLNRIVKDSLSDGRVTAYTYGPTWTASTNAEGSDTARWAADTIFEIAVRGGVAHRVRTFYDKATRYQTVAVWRDGQAVIVDSLAVDSAGRVWKMDYPGQSYRDTLRYNSDGLLSKIALHGVDSMRTLLRPDHDLAGLSHTNPGFQSAFGYSYVSDTLGRVAEMILANQRKFEDYTYDALGRLSGFNRWLASGVCPTTDTLSEFGTRCSTVGASLLAQGTFTYDAADNRTDGSALADNANRLARFSGDSMLYDLDGNMTRKFWIADSSVFNQRLYWNSQGQLDSIRTVRQGVLVVAKFGYDGEGRRARKTVGTTTTYYIYSGLQVVAEYTSSGSLQRHYTYYPGIDLPHSVSISGTRFDFMTDGRGNVGGLEKNDGSAIYAIYRYTPWGDADSTYEFSITNNIRFAGRELDPETGLYYMRARYYDPQVGRFVSEDPIGLVGGVNPYVYVSGDPINSRDPSGLLQVPVVLAPVVEELGWSELLEGAGAFARAHLLRAVQFVVGVWAGILGLKGEHVEHPKREEEDGPPVWIKPKGADGSPPPPPPPPLGGSFGGCYRCNGPGSGGFSGGFLGGLSGSERAAANICIVDKWESMPSNGGTAYWIQCKDGRTVVYQE